MLTDEQIATTLPTPQYRVDAPPACVVIRPVPQPRTTVSTRADLPVVRRPWWLRLHEWVQDLRLMVATWREG